MDAARVSQIIGNVARGIDAAERLRGAYVVETADRDLGEPISVGSVTPVFSPSASGLMPVLKSVERLQK